MTPTAQTPTLAAQIEALAPCPKCNGQGALRVSSDGEAEWVRCTVCHYEGPIKYCATDAIIAWNTRPAIVTALRRAEAAPGVVEAVNDLFNGALVEHGARGYGRDSQQKHDFTKVVSELQEQVLTALARQHGAREGKIGMEYDPYEEAEREEKKRIAADVRRRFPAAPATDVGAA